MSERNILKESCNLVGGLCLVVVSFVLQGCPHSYHIESNKEAFIYTPLDTTYVRRYHTKGIYYKEEGNLPPNAPGVNHYVYWYCPEKYEFEYDNSLTYDEELHNLHVRRITENGDCYVLLDMRVKINGTDYIWSEFYSPQIEIINGDTIYKEQPPCSIAQAIDSLKKYYPDYVISIDGKEEKSIYSSIASGSAAPSITIK